MHARTVRNLDYCTVNVHVYMLPPCGIWSISGSQISLQLLLVANSYSVQSERQSAPFTSVLAFSIGIVSMLPLFLIFLFLFYFIFFWYFLLSFPSLPPIRPPAPLRKENKHDKRLLCLSTKPLRTYVTKMSWNLRSILCFWQKYFNDMFCVHLFYSVWIIVSLGHRLW